jgi:hypothetical protein
VIGSANRSKHRLESHLDLTLLAFEVKKLKSVILAVRVPGTVRLELLLILGRLNSSYGVRRSSILECVGVGSRHGLRHHEDYLCRSSENTHRRVIVLYT